MSQIESKRQQMNVQCRLFSQLLMNEVTTRIHSITDDAKKQHECTMVR
jgi:hypothetical protein